MSESGTTGTFTFAVNANDLPVTVYTVSGTATPGVDYTALSGSVVIPAGSGNRSVNVTVTPIQDALLEDLESITVTLTPSASYVTWPASSQATMWLYDDDQPTVFVDAASTVPTEAGTASSFYISRTVATTSALTVNYTMSGTATNGTDYALLSGTATIPANALGIVIPITPTNDTTAEGTESIIMTLAAGSYSRSPLPATLYLTDNDTLTPSVAFTTAGSTVAESAGTVNIPVTLTSPPSGNVTVDYVIGAARRPPAAGSISISSGGPSLSPPASPRSRSRSPSSTTASPSRMRPSSSRSSTQMARKSARTRITR